jgi:2'-5' RNA ligase
MRLFIAVNFSDEVKERLIAAQGQLRVRALAGRFSREEHLHLTLVFLGETPESRLPELRRIMEGIHGQPFRFTLTRGGFFKRPGGGLWWIGAEEERPGETGPLSGLQGQLAAMLLAQGFPIDTKPFKAHITLGRDIRLRERLDPALLVGEPVTVPVNRVSLMRSEYSGGLVYTELFGYNLK